MAQKSTKLGILAIVGWTLAAPWVVIWAVLRAGLWVRRSVGSAFALRRAMADELFCPIGHGNSSAGRWECRCGFVFLGWAFAPCPNCGETAGWFPCAVCGLGVRSPLR